MGKNNGVIYHCIKCGKTWGSGRDIESHGICDECLALWCRQKQRDKGLKECFGEFKQWDDLDCDNCSWKKQCKENYEIRQDLSRRLKESTGDT